MNDLEKWCQNNELSSVYQNLVDLEFKNLGSLSVLDEDDIKELVSELNLKFGRKANFLLALENLKKESKDSPSDDVVFRDFDFEQIVSPNNADL